MQPAPAHQKISASAITERGVTLLLKLRITAEILLADCPDVEWFPRLLPLESDLDHVLPRLFTWGGSYCSEPSLMVGECPADPAFTTTLMNLIRVFDFLLI